MQFIGQDRLVNIFKQYTLTTLPKTMLFLGEDGCGKHTLARKVADDFNFQLVTIDDKITPEQIVDYMQKPVYTLFLIDLMKFTDKQQNQFLKFIEEPSQYNYIVLTACSTIGILPTILNRCVKFTFDPYTQEQLKVFDWLNPVEDPLVYNICRTPGTIMEVNMKNVRPLYDLCKTIIDAIMIVPYANLMKVATKINYKEDYDKFTFKYFFKMLNFVAFDEYKKTGNDNAFKIYLSTLEAEQDFALARGINKENYMYSFLNRIWRRLR